MTEHEAGPDLSAFMSLIAQQATTSQHAQQYDANRTAKFIEYVAHWLTNSKRLPATATVKRQGDTIVMTVTVDRADNATPAAIALPSGK